MEPENVKPESGPWKRRFLFEIKIFRFYVCFPECTLYIHVFLKYLKTSGCAIDRLCKMILKFAVKVITVITTVFLFLSQIMDIIWQDDFFGVFGDFCVVLLVFCFDKNPVGKLWKIHPRWNPPKACSIGRVCRSCRPTHGVDALTLLGCRGSWIRCWFGGSRKKKAMPPWVWVNTPPI